MVQVSGVHVKAVSSVWGTKQLVPKPVQLLKRLVCALLVMCAAGGKCARQSSVKCVGYLTIGSQASAAAEKISFVDFSRRWGSWVFGTLYYSDWLCGLQNLPQNHVMVST